MSDNKTYYYLKLKENFYDREEIRIIKGLEDGDKYINIMLEMYLRSLKRNGSLMVTDTIPFTISTLASVLHRKEVDVEKAVNLFVEFKLVEILESGEIHMLEIENFVGKSSTEGDRKRARRKGLQVVKNKALEDRSGQTSGQMSDKRPPEIEIELEIETEIERINASSHDGGKVVSSKNDQNVESVVQIWGGLFGIPREKIVIDVNLRRRILGAINGTPDSEGLGVSGVIESIKKYYRYLTKPEFYFTHQFTLFDFFLNPSKGVSRFFYATDESMYTREPKKAENRRSGGF